MILNIEKICKSFPQADSGKINVIEDLNLHVKKGETVAITGHSGSGKTTLLSLLSGLDTPDSGTINLDGIDIGSLSEDKLAKVRAEKIGIVFQRFHLMPHLSAFENVSLPLEILKKKNIDSKVNDSLEKVGILHRKKHTPGQLSGGECQRVAIARALAVEPSILLADEPTGNLDNKTGNQITELLFDLVDKIDMTLILVTHNLELADRCQTKYKLSKGRLQ